MNAIEVACNVMKQTSEEVEKHHVSSQVTCKGAAPSSSMTCATPRERVPLSGFGWLRLQDGQAQMRRQPHFHRH